MTEITPNLNLRSLGPTELPHGFNAETLQRLDVATVTRLVSTTTTTPPGSPATQDAYYVSQGSLGTAWEDYSESIVYWTGGSWEGFPAYEGMVAYSLADGNTRSFLGGEWVQFNESLVMTKTFNTLYSRDAHFGMGVDQVLVQGIAGQGTYSVLRPLVYGDLSFTSSVNGSVPLGCTTESRISGGYPLYRYRGNVTSPGGEAAMPSLQKVSVDLHANTSLLRLSPALKVNWYPADSGEQRSLVTWFGETVDLDEQVAYGPSGTDLVSLPGVLEVPSGGGADYSYTHSVSWTGNLPLSAGYVSLDFADGTFGYGPSYTGGDIDVSMVVTVEITNAY